MFEIKKLQATPNNKEVNEIFDRVQKYFKKVLVNALLISQMSLGLFSDEQYFFISYLLSPSDSLPCDEEDSPVEEQNCNQRSIET